MRGVADLFRRRHGTGGVRRHLLPHDVAVAVVIVPLGGGGGGFGLVTSLLLPPSANISRAPGESGHCKERKKEWEK